ncbi:60S ribosomal protein L7 [Scaptodrosophila lebanonensis]|uniref:60S ribosomal protein L7 n=1 Tax=Drosophila lebanonensis TaxID=7225 RepID=A0A6J2U5J1_DROLE|nr:60S ribosomal protein L7 [Scaptodrosophila lebanonensis]
MSDKYAVPNKLPGKTVSVLKHRKRRIQQDQSVVQQKRQNRLNRVKKLKAHHSFKRAESFVMDYLKAERTSKRIKQTLLRTNVTKQSADAAEKTNQKLLLVMRHAGKKIHDETTLKIFKTLRMSQRHNAVFLENTKENQLLLRVIEPFVVYGFPTISTIRDLLFKKGFALVNGKKEAIQSNTMVEEQLGEKGVICLEDIIHEIFTVGPNFEAVTKFLCTFKLSSPRDGWKKKVSVSFKRGGEYGNRENGINDLIARCI